MDATSHDTDARDRGNLDGVGLYNGKCLIGSTFALGCRYAAELSDGTDLGTYPNRQAAENAILAAAKARS